MYYLVHDVESVFRLVLSFITFIIKCMMWSLFLD